jgi:hypothetical protein
VGWLVMGMTYVHIADIFQHHTLCTVE